MRKKSKLDSQPKKDFIAKSIAAGVPQTKIADQLQCHQSSISRIKDDEEMQELVKEQQYSFAEVLSDAVQFIKDAVRDKTLDPQLRLKAALRVVETFGVANSGTPSAIVLNMQKTTGCNHNPLIDKMIDEFQSRIAYDEEETS